MNHNNYGISNNSTFGLHHQPLTTTHKQMPNGISNIDYDTERILNAMTPEMQQYSDHIYAFVTNLKADLGITNLSDKFDCLYFFAAATQSDSFINWAQPGTYDCTLVGLEGAGIGRVTFRVFRGWSSNSTTMTSCINTNFNNFNLNTNFTGTYSDINQAGGSWGIYLNSGGGWLQGEYYVLGAVSGAGGTPMCFVPKSSGGHYTYGCLTVNRPGSGINQFNSETRNLDGGYYSCIKPDNDNCELYFNGNLIDSRAAPTSVTAVQDRGVVILGGVNIGSTGTGVNILANASAIVQFSFFYIGAKDIKQDVVYRRVAEYLYSVGGQCYISTNRLT